MPIPLLPLAAERAVLPLFANVHIHPNYYIHLPILLVVISLVYAATRFDDWGQIIHEAIRWGLRLLAFLVIIGAVLFGAYYLLPRISPW